MTKTPDRALWPQILQRIGPVLVLSAFVSGCGLPDVFTDPREASGPMSSADLSDAAESSNQDLVNAGEGAGASVAAVRTGAHSRAYRQGGISAGVDRSDAYYDRVRKQQEANQKRWDAEARRALKSVCDDC